MSQPPKHFAPRTRPAVWSDEEIRDITAGFGRAVRAAVAEHHARGHSDRTMVDGKIVEVPLPDYRSQPCADVLTPG